jgi:two-component system response regulator HydG
MYDIMPTPPEGQGLKMLLETYERQLIEQALAITEGNQRRAAAHLGVLPTTLHEKMKRLGLIKRTAEREATRLTAHMA